VSVVDDVEPNPRVGTVDRLADAARGAGAAVVVAVGGGSVIDAAKGIALLLRNPGSGADYEGRNRFASPAAPLVAIPTTCGTGSEVTWVSVLSLPTEQRKISVKGDGLFPAWALVDPDVLSTLPRELLAQTGMDAMTHAVEAYVGLRANPASDALAEKAVALLLQALPRAAGEPNPEALDAVMRASTLAGMAFGNADVGAVHCLSEAIGGLLDLPHGLLNAVLLVPVLAHHGPAAMPRLAGLARAVGVSASPDDSTSAAALLDRLRRLSHDVGIPSYAALGIPREAHGTIARLAEGNGSNASNPRPWTAADYAVVLDAL